MASKHLLLVVTLTALFAAGCSSDSDDDNGSANIQAIHVAPGAGNLTVYLDGTALSESLPYADLSEELSVAAEERVGVRILVEGSPTPIYDESRTFRDDRDYLMIIGRANSTSTSTLSDEIRVSFVSGQSGALEGDDFGIQFGNFTRTVDRVDVYLSFAGTDPFLSAPIESGIGESQISRFDNAEAGRFDLTFTSQGSSVVLYQIRNIELKSGMEYSVLLVEDEDRSNDFTALVYEATDSDG